MSSVPFTSITGGGLVPLDLSYSVRNRQPLPPLEPGFISVIYVRMSDPHQLLNYTPAHYERVCRAKIAELGGTVKAVFIEQGKGYDWTRADLHKVLAMARRGEIHCMMSFDTARLARDTLLSQTIERELHNLGVHMLYATIQFPDTPEGRTQRGFHALMDEMETDRILTRTSGGIVEKRLKQEVIGNGPAPYGYRYTYNARGRKAGYQFDPETGPILIRIFCELKERTLSDICRDLNAAQVPTPSGRGRWQPGTISRLLDSAVYLGDYQFGKTKRTRGANGKTRFVPGNPDSIMHLEVPAYLTYGELREIHDALDDRRRRRRPRRPDDRDPYVFRGRLFCAYCDGVLACTVNNGYRRYSCGRAYPKQATHKPKGTKYRDVMDLCRLPEIHAEQLEARCWEHIAVELATPQRVIDELLASHDASDATMLHRARVEHVDEELARLRAKLERLEDEADLYPKDSEGRTLNARARQQADQEITRYSQERAKLEREAPRLLTEADREQMRAAIFRIGARAYTANASEQRRLLADLGIKITVALAAPGDADAVKLGRKHTFRLQYSGRIGLSHSVTSPSVLVALWDSPPLAAGHRRLRLA